MLNKLITKFVGSRNERLVKKMGKAVQKINDLEEQTKKLSDEELKAKTLEYRQRVTDGESLDAMLPEAFALVREASLRSMGLRHYDVRLVGGMGFKRDAGAASAGLEEVGVAGQRQVAEVQWPELDTGLAATAAGQGAGAGRLRRTRVAGAGPRAADGFPGAVNGDDLVEVRHAVPRSGRGGRHLWHRRRRRLRRGGSTGSGSRKRWRG